MMQAETQQQPYMQGQEGYYGEKKQEEQGQKTEAKFVPLETQYPALPEFNQQEIFVKAQQSKSFRTHAMIAGIASIAAFLGWTFQSFVVSSWPWFIAVWGAFALSLAVHFYLFERPKEYLQLHFVAFGIVNAVTFLSWTFSARYNSAYFVEVFFATLLLLSVHFCLSHFKESQNKWLNTHFTAYLVLNMFFFSLWLDLGKGAPWFMFVGLFLTYTLGLHFISAAQFPDKGWSVHVLTFGILNTFFFLTWAVTGMGLPWFFFPLAIWSILLVFHAVMKNRAAQKQQQLPVVTPIQVVSPPMSETATIVNIPNITVTPPVTEYQ